MKILIDMNLSPAWVPFLTQAGFECVHWSAVGSPRASDAELMSWARAHGHVIFTHDMDFGARAFVCFLSAPIPIRMTRPHDPGGTTPAWRELGSSPAERPAGM